MGELMKSTGDDAGLRPAMGDVLGSPSRKRHNRDSARENTFAQQTCDAGSERARFAGTGACKDEYARRCTGRGVLLGGR